MSTDVSAEDIDESLLQELRRQGGDINDAIEIYVRMENPEEFLSEMRQEVRQ